jgi:hypothetical protein
VECVRIRGEIFILEKPVRTADGENSTKCASNSNRDLGTRSVRSVGFGGYYVRYIVAMEMAIWYDMVFLSCETRLNGYHSIGVARNRSSNGQTFHELLHSRCNALCLVDPSYFARCLVLRVLPLEISIFNS